MLTVPMRPAANLGGKRAGYQSLLPGLKTAEFFKERAPDGNIGEIRRLPAGTAVAFREGAAERGRYITEVSGGYMAKDLEQRGLENQVKGTAKEVKGQVRGDIGDMTDDHSEHLKGRVEEAKGKIQKNFGKAEREIDESV